MDGPKPYEFTRCGVTDGPKPCEVIRFGAMDCPKPYEFIWVGAMDGPKTFKFIRFGAMDGPKPFKFIWFVAMDGPNRVALHTLIRIYIIEVGSFRSPCISKAIWRGSATLLLNRGHVINSVAKG